MYLDKIIKKLSFLDPEKMSENKSESSSEMVQLNTSRFLVVVEDPQQMLNPWR